MSFCFSTSTMAMSSSVIFCSLEKFWWECFWCEFVPFFERRGRNILLVDRGTTVLPNLVFACYFEIMTYWHLTGWTAFEPSRHPRWSCCLTLAESYSSEHCCSVLGDLLLAESILFFVSFLLIRLYGITHLWHQDVFCAAFVRSVLRSVAMQRPYNNCRLWVLACKLRHSTSLEPELKLKEFTFPNLKHIVMTNELQFQSSKNNCIALRVSMLPLAWLTDVLQDFRSFLTFRRRWLFVFQDSDVLRISPRPWWCKFMHK